MAYKKKPKKELSRLIKVSNIECTNGNHIMIGQRRRETESEPVVWEYEVYFPSEAIFYHGECTDKNTAFNEALDILNKWHF